MSDSEKYAASDKRRGMSFRARLVLALVFVHLAGGLSCAARAQENAPLQNPSVTKAESSLSINKKTNARVGEGESAAHAKKTREAQIRDLVRRVNAAILQEDFALAEGLLGTLGHFLPERSLTMLRIRAWLSFSSGQDAAAREAYLEILERIENDENAGINLAILATRAGQGKEAERILADLARRHPDSQQLRAVRQALGMDIDNYSSQGTVFEE
ncbi:MAG: tetratricopeptide repeat protein [Zoogloeaceae bacterium]|jgi:tetratricopeptide (TPR) repeat protein|nr:tetratricopeptide repeat protein [Zoogloeaceae bacterium]